MDKILIIKTGSTMPALAARKGDFEDWILRGLGSGPGRAQVVDVCGGAPLPPPAEVSGVVVTGSHAMVTEHQAWSERAAAWLRGAVEAGTPLLGICYGHQLLAYALGGEVGDNPRGREYGTVEVRLTEAARGDALLGGLESPLRVHVGHVQTVLRLPAGATLLASSGADAHQAFVVGERAWGVQFHPEFDAQVTRAYLEANRRALAEEGQDPAALLAASGDTPYGGQILRRFAQLAGSA